MVDLPHVVERDAVENLHAVFKTVFAYLLIDLRPQRTPSDEQKPELFAVSRLMQDFDQVGCALVDLHPRHAAQDDVIRLKAEFPAQFLFGIVLIVAAERVRIKPYGSYPDVARAEAFQLLHCGCGFCQHRHLSIETKRAHSREHVHYLSAECGIDAEGSAYIRNKTDAMSFAKPVDMGDEQLLIAEAQKPVQIIVQIGYSDIAVLAEPRQRYIADGKPVIEMILDIRLALPDALVDDHAVTHVAQLPAESDLLTVVKALLSEVVENSTKNSEFHRLYALRCVFFRKSV